jgi:type I restriction enzyme M protein
MVQIIDPGLDDAVYDPSCGTGGFLAQAFEYVSRKDSPRPTAEQLQALKQQKYWGREKENLVYPMALANLVLHGIDKPNIWHGNTLTNAETYGGLYEGAPPQFDVILTNPPFGGKEGKDAQTGFDYKTGSTQVLFLQHIIRSLKPSGRCGIVLDEGLLFRTTEDAFVKTKRKLLDDCDVWAIVSLPSGVFNAAGAGVKTNLVFFTKGERTKKIWYYDLSDLKIRKRAPLELSHFSDLFATLPKRKIGRLSWVVDFDARKAEAAKAAAPFRSEAVAKVQQASALKESLAARKRAKAPQAELDNLDQQIGALTREARIAEAKAQEIEDAAYDLKAVNPNRTTVVDKRTPRELIDFIEDQGTKIAETLKSLRGLT